jgi:hypothetical protein
MTSISSCSKRSLGPAAVVVHGRSPPATPVRGAVKGQS